MVRDSCHRCHETQTDRIRVYEQQEPCAAIFGDDTISDLSKRLDSVGVRVSAELERQGFKADQIKLDRMLHMRFNGSDTSLMMYVNLSLPVLANTRSRLLTSSSEPSDSDWATAFKAAYKTEFGFLLESEIVVDDIKVKGVGKAWSDIGQSVFDEIKSLPTTTLSRDRDNGKISSFQDVYVSPPGQAKGERVETPVLVLQDLDAGDVVEGPALVIDATQTIFVNA